MFLIEFIVLYLIVRLSQLTIVHFVSPIQRLHNIL
jgi:hypothetical protein